MRPLVLITACAYHRERMFQCRRTWLNAWGHLIDYKFVLGVGNQHQADDELIFDVDDSYYGLPAKIQASHKWALNRGYSRILKTDCDVYLHIPRLLSSCYESASYTGNFYYSEFAMGAAYWLDARATQILIDSPLPYPGTPGGDDVWVGRVMKENKVSKQHDGRYYIGHSPDWDTVISVHTSGPPPISMAEIHARIGHEPSV